MTFLWYSKQNKNHFYTTYRYSFWDPDLHQISHNFFPWLSMAHCIVWLAVIWQRNSFIAEFAEIFFSFSKTSKWRTGANSTYHHYLFCSEAINCWGFRKNLKGIENINKKLVFVFLYRFGHIYCMNIRHFLSFLFSSFLPSNQNKFNRLYTGQQLKDYKVIWLLFQKTKWHILLCIL